MNSPQFINEQKINNFDFLINYLITSLFVYNQYLSVHKSNSTFLNKLFDNNCLYQSIQFLPQYFKNEINLCMSFIDFCFSNNCRSNCINENKIEENSQNEENNCFSKFNNNIENAFDPNEFILQQIIQATDKIKFNKEDKLSCNDEIISQKNGLPLKEDLNKQNIVILNIKKLISFSEKSNRSIKEDSKLNIEKKINTDENSKIIISQKEGNKEYNITINGQKEEHKENFLKSCGSFITYKECKKTQSLKQGSPNELELNEEETSEGTKNNKIFDIEKIKDKNKHCSLGYSFYSKGVLVTKPNEDFIKSRKFSDDSINKKIKANCFKCLNNILGDDTLFSQFLITNVGINFNKKLLESTIGEILRTALAEKNMNETQIKEKINYVVGQNTLRQELLNLNFTDFYQDVFLKSKELESKLMKIEEKEPYIYFKKYEYRVKSFILYFKNNKGNNILKQHKKKFVK